MKIKIILGLLVCLFTTDIHARIGSCVRTSAEATQNPRIHSKIQALGNLDRLTGTWRYQDNVAVFANRNGTFYGGTAGAELLPIRICDVTNSPNMLMIFLDNAPKGYISQIKVRPAGRGRINMGSPQRYMGAMADFQKVSESEMAAQSRRIDRTPSGIAPVNRGT